MKVLVILAGLFSAVGAEAAPRWTCLAQDKSYSYEAEGSTESLATRAALATCRDQSDNPKACYAHRCWISPLRRTNNSSFPL